MRPPQMGLREELSVHGPHDVYTRSLFGPRTILRALLKLIKSGTSILANALRNQSGATEKHAATD